jgi:serpin B
MDFRQSIADQTDVALTLSKQLISTDAKNTNLVFSPLSIHVILSLIAAGSKPGGPTQDQLLHFLRSKSTDHLNSFCSETVSVVFADGNAVGGPSLSFANGVWVDESFSLKPSFKQVVDNVYKAVANQADFQNKAPEVAAEVNTWAEKKTNGLIKEVLPEGSVDHMTRLVFANALYFKGAWDAKFDASKTKEQNFHLLNGGEVAAPFMTSKKKQFVRAFDNFKVLGLPYKQGNDKRRFSMYIFLPNANDGFSALAEKMSSNSGFLNKHLPYEQVEVGDFMIPRFKITFGFEASNVLKTLGLVLPFDGEGGLTEMVDSPVSRDLHVSSIFHKSFIEVNEEGTEAASASAAVIQLRSVAFGGKIDFVADHPFLFFIREDMTGVVMFVGHVLNPLED